MNSREFTFVYSKGKKYFSPFFRLIIQSGDFKLSVAIPKKKIKRRVDRNKEKRRIIHIMKDIFNHQPPQNNIIIFLQKDTQKLSLIELKKEIKIILKKTSLL